MWKDSFARSRQSCMLPLFSYRYWNSSNRISNKWQTVLKMSPQLHHFSQSWTWMDSEGGTWPWRNCTSQKNSATEWKVCATGALTLPLWQSRQPPRHCRIIPVYLTLHKLQMWSSSSSETSCWRADEASQVNAVYCSSKVYPKKEATNSSSFTPFYFSNSSCPNYLVWPVTVCVCVPVWVMFESTECVYTSRPSHFVIPLSD